MRNAFVIGRDSRSMIKNERTRDRDAKQDEHEPGREIVLSYYFG